MLLSLLQQYVKILQAIIKSQKKIIERQKVAMSHIDVHNAMVRRILEKTLTQDREELPKLMPVTPSSDSD